MVEYSLVCVVVCVVCVRSMDVAISPQLEVHRVIGKGTSNGRIIRIFAMLFFPPSTSLSAEQHEGLKLQM